ncbi:hypothetical protein [Cytophaga hutchinsonii]|nr:hypothetical protein [Cytophaga hutchinsonii]SFX46726.1 hypothetical protein SAMN04487930_104239 [Cytophaga hutchinsonii ATCC 33406]
MHRITLVLLLMLLTFSCKKKEDPQPSTPSGTGGTGGTTTTKTIQFYQAYIPSGTNGKVNYFFFAKDPDALVAHGTLNGSVRPSNSTSACYDPASYTVMSNLIYGSRYHYQIKSGNAASSTVIIDGYFTISAAGTVTLEQVQPTSGPRMVYEECGATKGSFTVYCQYKN